MTTEDKGKLFILFLPLFTFSILSIIVCSLWSNTWKFIWFWFGFQPWWIFQESPMLLLHPWSGRDKMWALIVRPVVFLLLTSRGTKGIKSWLIICLRRYWHWRASQIRTGASSYALLKILLEKIKEVLSSKVTVTANRQMEYISITSGRGNRLKEWCDETISFCSRGGMEDP